MNRINNLSVVIPCFNEERRIETTLFDTYYWCINNVNKFEIILVNDGSTDNTLKIINIIRNNISENDIKIITYEENRGKGFAVKQGVQSSQYEWVLFMDADNATKISELEKFIPFMDYYDLIIGSRNLKDSNIIIKQPVFRRILGKCFSYLVRIIIKTGIKDTQCGFKLFNKTIAKIFNYQTCERFAFDVELIKNAEIGHYKIKEVGINWQNDEQSKVHPLLDVCSMLNDLNKIRKIGKRK